MEFPFGHHHRHGHREGEEEGGRRGDEPYYPPPGYNPHGAPRGWESPPPPPPAFPPPPPPYRGGEGEYRPWDADQRAGYGPGPVYPAVQHVAHEVSPGPYAGEEEEGGRGQHWWHRRHGHGHGDGHQGEPPFSVQPVSHETCGSGTVAPAALPRTVRVFTKAGEDYSLSIREGKVVLARADRGDEYQHWIKDEKFSTKVKDKEGFPCFALVNKVTGEAIKHSIGASHPVRLVPYNPDYLDESVLWTLALDTGEGFRAIRMVNNTSLNFDALHGDDDHGGVHDGTTVVLWEWWKGKNQRWKIVPYCECKVTVGESLASFCREIDSLSANNKLFLC